MYFYVEAILVSSLFPSLEHAATVPMQKKTKQLSMSPNNLLVGMLYFSSMNTSILNQGVLQEC